MKKRNVIIVAVLSLLCIVIAFIFMNGIGQKPFLNLKKEDIKEVTLELYPPNTKTTLKESEIESLVEILQKVVIYNEDNTYGNYNGQMVVYSIIKTDDTVIVIQASNPFLVIDGTGYKTKYEPCEELSNLGNGIGDANYD